MPAVTSSVCELKSNDVHTFLAFGHCYYAIWGVGVRVGRVVVFELSSARLNCIAVTSNFFFIL